MQLQDRRVNLNRAYMICHGSHQQSLLHLVSW